MKNILTCLLLLICCSLFSQTTIYPGNWWTGMKANKVQLLIHSKGNNAVNTKISTDYPGVSIVTTHVFENARYIAADILVAPSAKPGIVHLALSGNGRSQTIAWPLRERRKGNGHVYAQGVTSADLIYLLVPDRFSNGDASNDRFTNMNDTSCDRNNPFLRHGGDLQGIINHLDYFRDLGATALWLTPVVENDQALTNEGGNMRSAYHGYAFTDQYNVDRRFGGNAAYKRMVDSAHRHGLKIIQDAVYNHIGNKHFLFLDPPAKDWFNQWPAYTNTSYKDQPLVDPYASKSDYNIAINGWFTPFMPDLNQRNPYVASFLIQYALWAVEEFGIDGWRVDTYFYSDRDFLNNINTALYREFPKISVFGETTMQSVTEQAYYMQNNIATAWKSNLQGVTDYAWFSNAIKTLTWKTGQTNSGYNLYNILVEDILYKDPMRNELFLDNHDQDRFFSVIDEDFERFKMGMALLLTQRGIPTLYYGTEVLMKNKRNPSDAEVRRDFPGGWAADAVNKFVSQGRNPMENEAFSYIKTLAQFRLHSSAIKTGRTMQFLPQDDLYVYFRYDKTQTVMCIMNTGDREKTVDFAKYAERTKGFTKALNIINNNAYLIPGNLSIPSKTMWVLNLQ